MTMQRWEIEQAIQELEDLEGCQVQKITQSGPKELCLQIRRPGETLTLFLSIEPSHEFFCLVPRRPPSLPQPPTFCMTLRKHLLNARWLEAWTVGEDRILCMMLRRGEETYLLYMELVPRQGKWILCKENGEILQAFPASHPTRVLRPGVDYEPPEHEGGPPLQKQDNNIIELDTTQAFPFHDALYRKYVVTQEAERLERLRQAALRQRKSKLKKAKRLLGNLERDWLRCEATLEVERDAELLKHNLHMIQRGAKEVLVVDYYDPDMTERPISLDPALSPQANLQKLFHKIKRARRGISYITQRMEGVEEEIATYEEQIQTIKAIDSLEAMMDWVPGTTSQQGHKVSSRAQERKSYREFQSSDGKPIWVGRASKDNDELTLRIAKGNDLWLHVRGWAGSHVIVPLQRNESVPSETLVDAATLAVHFSQAKEQTHTDVMYTHVKYVKKPKGAPAGQVTVIQDKNIALRREPERLKRLLDTQDTGNSAS